MHTITTISHSDALKIILELETKLSEKQLAAAVAVVDGHGELVAMLRTDGCRLSCIDVAINKAYTAARERGRSKALGDAAKREGFPLTNFGGLRYVTWGGGVPIVTKAGEVVGAVGVSGLSETEDTELAEMGAALPLL
jgi:glc operon protein GlcG